MINMKTKYLISALALPALLAACTNDDFMESQAPSKDVASDLLAGRGTVELALNATKSAANVDTRVVGESTSIGALNWMWEPSDRLGGVIVDYGRSGTGQFGEIVDVNKGYENYVITNYNFNANIKENAPSSTFSTPSAVVEGAYIFYNQYNPALITRGQIGTELEEYINVKGGEENGLQQVGTKGDDGQNFFISPIMNVGIEATEEGAKLEIPIGLTSIYSVLRLRMKADLKPSGTTDYYKNGFKVYKIELEPTKEGETFKRSFILNPADLATLQIKVREENPTLPILFNGAINTKAPTELVEKAIEKVLAKISDPNNEIGESNGDSEKLIYQVTEGLTFWGPDDEIDLLVLIPAGKYTKNDDPEELGGDGTKHGVLKLNVYTSQGVYRTYVMREQKLEGSDTYTFERGKQYARMCEMYIDGDKSNIDLYDFTQNGFDVATTEDWNYAIEYINNQYRDFGTGTNWKTPKLNLSNYKGKDIEVDAEHYFPNFRVIYQGKANLKLVGQKEYTIDPTKVILGNGSDEKTARPTIKIEDAEASVKFVGDVKEDNTLGTDGTNYTAAIKLISNAAIIIAEDQEVNFEKLVSNTALNIAKGAVVNVEKVDGETTMTDGTVTLAEGNNEKAGAIFNVNGNYQNDGTLTIGKLAEANQPSSVSTENNGDIIVDGELNMNWLKNNADATLTVKAWDVEMDDRMSGKATIPALTNDGFILLEARKQDASGTYGGELIVASLLDNRADITVQGRMEVAELRNMGVVTLSEGEYKYAWIQIKQGASTGDGKIVLSNPADYEFYDRYFSGEQNLSEVKGVIEATLDADTYAKVLANHGEASLGDQERAWDVINKVIVKGELPLKAEMGEKNKDFFLIEDATLNAQANLTLNSLTTGGAATLAAKNAETVISVETNVNVNANLTIEKNAKVVITPSSVTMLTVAQGATLTNKGWIDTENPDEKSVYINAVVKGTLVNQGKLAQELQPVYDGAGYDFIVELLNGLNQNGQYVGTYGETATEEKMVPRVEKWEAGDINWTTNVYEQFSEDDLKKLLAEGEYTKIGDYAAIKGKTKVRGLTPVLYLGLEKGKEPDADFNTARKDAKLVNDAFKNEQSKGADRATTSSWFVVSDSNGGTLDLLYSINPANANHSWAYGKVVNSPSIIRMGRFNNELQEN